MVGVGNLSLPKDQRLPLHHPPIPNPFRSWLLPVELLDAGELDAAHALRIPGGNINGFPTFPVAEFEDVRLAAVATTDRLVVQDAKRIGFKVRDRKEEPLALAKKGGIPATVPHLLGKADLTEPDFARLQ